MAARQPYTTQNMVQPVHYSLSTYTAKQMKTMYYSLNQYSQQYDIANKPVLKEQKKSKL